MVYERVPESHCKEEARAESVAFKWLNAKQEDGERPEGGADEAGKAVEMEKAKKAQELSEAITELEEEVAKLYVTADVRTESLKDDEIVFLKDR